MTGQKDAEIQRLSMVNETLRIQLHDVLHYLERVRSQSTSGQLPTLQTIPSPAVQAFSTSPEQTRHYPSCDCVDNCVSDKAVD